MAGIFECPKCGIQVKDYKTRYCPRCNRKIEYISEQDYYKRERAKELDLIQNRMTAAQSNLPKCPYCQSTSLKKITTGGRMLSVGFFGLASGKIGKQWHCNNCGSDF